MARFPSLDPPDPSDAISGSSGSPLGSPSFFNSPEYAALAAPAAAAPRALPQVAPLPPDSPVIKAREMMAQALNRAETERVLRLPPLRLAQAEPTRETLTRETLQRLTPAEVAKDWASSIIGVGPASDRRRQAVEQAKRDFGPLGNPDAAFMDALKGPFGSRVAPRRETPPSGETDPRAGLNPAGQRVSVPLPDDIDANAPAERINPDDEYRRKARSYISDVLSR